MIQRYYASLQWRTNDGNCVLYDDHRAAVRELVEALQDLLDDQTDARLSVVAQAIAAIVKHQDGEG